ncbi:MAG: hypothetical protein WD226_04365 [Planctomycetota bacterium]
MSAVARDWRSAPLPPEALALAAFAEALTIDPGAMEALHVERLRAAGFDDVAIHDAIQVTSYFNYINRIADGMHIDLEPEMEPYAER